MALAPVSTTAPTTQQRAQAAFGLEFESLLRIILTQLTYQDPLKPLENSEFVSQLAQFSQLQQSQSLNDQITNLLAAQSATQATALLGKTVDISAGVGTVSGKVETISFTSGAPTLTLRTTDGQTISNIAIANVAQIRE
jgi:flagellar basal-body rod modification protein FlgD